MKSRIRRTFVYIGLFLIVFMVAFGAHAGIRSAQNRLTYNAVHEAVTEYFTAALHHDVRKQMSLAVWQAIPKNRTYQVLLETAKVNPLLKYHIDKVAILGPTSADVIVSSAAKGFNKNKMTPANIQVLKQNGKWTLHFNWN